MNIGFYLTGKDPLAFVFADRLIRSARATMPDVPITQLSDEKTCRVYGVDAIRRKKPDVLSVARSAHYADLAGDWLLLDTDCIIERDVRHIFEESFDVAVIDREWPHLPELSKSFREKMPYCAGVVFSREPRFWERVHQHVVAMTGKDKAWYGDQMAIPLVMTEGQFDCRVLPGSIYQYPPATAKDNLTGVAITHYKGPDRKRFLLRRIQQESFA